MLYLLVRVLGDVSDERDRGLEVPVLITARGKKLFHLVGIMLGRVKNFDISNPMSLPSPVHPRVLGNS